MWLTEWDGCGRLEWVWVRRQGLRIELDERGLESKRMSEERRGMSDEWGT